MVRQFDALLILADVKAIHNINISSFTTVTLVQGTVISYWNYCRFYFLKIAFLQSFYNLFSQQQLEPSFTKDNHIITLPT